MKTSKKKKKPKIGGKVKVRYEKDWYTEELVAYNKDIDQWTIYFKDDNYTDYVIFPDKDVKIE